MMALVRPSVRPALDRHTFYTPLFAGSASDALHSQYPLLLPEFDKGGQQLRSQYRTCPPAEHVKYEWYCTSIRCRRPMTL